MGDIRQLFIVGSGRSGTTIVASTLSQSPLIFKFNNFEPKLFSDMNGFAGLSSVLYTNKYNQDFLRGRAEFFFKRKEGDEIIGFHNYLEWEDFSKIYNNFWESSTNNTNNKAQLIHCIREFYTSFWGLIFLNTTPKWIIDDTPINALRIKEIFDVFPNAKVIHVIRDGRQVAFGHMRLGWVNSFSEGVHLWKTRTEEARSMARHMSIGKEKYKEVIFEKICESPNEYFSDIFSWLGVDFSSEYLRKSDFKAKYVNKYKVSEYEDDLFRCVAGDMIEEFGWT